MPRILTIEVNPNTKKGKAFLEMVDLFRNQSGVKVVNIDQEISIKTTESKASFIKKISQETNRKLTQRLLAEHNIVL
ncbi:hypothetical protein OKE80_06115 [Riemerella anatipestifer]|uniref:Uncharacterized protein n=1 Tax=Riemerella anatipestifer TaxID=34085 RepID=A0AAP3EZE0_RIEAN|nr:hypothetical protein [Riemerella anatipestifer]AZZ58485.1 hypothetical protein AWB57_05225 [Riemerella anatipestifer]MBT0573073.1 hypothetical protein [Riemerella anatipestifer]MCO7318924.1 hypothetical protein [Riemerella anatipestifer]MCQ4155209.1 hypothetical protein [Riemerella anatipestifer]MCQ4181182.1 hypothetical protein [Riemerella anatipestifer]